MIKGFKDGMIFLKQEYFFEKLLQCGMEEKRQTRITQSITNINRLTPWSRLTGGVNIFEVL